MIKTIRLKPMMVVAMAMTVGTIYAQTGGEGESLDRQVDVSRDYMPTVRRAAKLSVYPTMKDTTLLSPEFDYSINPQPMTSGFGVAAINPVNVNTSLYNPLYPVYVKIGGGYPAQSLLDLYVNSTSRGSSSLGFYANHYGQYSKIENDAGNKNKSGKMTNAFGVTGSARFGGVVLAGELGMDYNQFSRYGQADMVEGPVESVRQKFTMPRASLSFGNDFSDLSRLNFRVTAGGYYMKDDFHNVEMSGRAGIEVAKIFNREHKMTIKADYEGMFGDDSLAYYKNHVITFGPRYDLFRDDVRIGIGADFVFDIREGHETVAMALPGFSLSFPSVLDGKLVPYVDFTSRLEVNSYRNLTARNPYINENDSLLGNTRRYDGRLGITGSFSGAVGYRLFGGVSYMKDPVVMANYFSYAPSTTFVMLAEKSITQYVFGLEVEGNIASSFSAEMGFHYYSYNTKTYEHASGMPDYDLGLKLKWNYRSRFFIGAGVQYIGDREFIEFGYDAMSEPVHFFTEQKPVVDVSFDMEYRLNRKVGIFLSGRNLANSPLYEFNHYPDQGTTINAGLKLLF